MSGLRADLQVVADLVPENTRLLDIGCGDGALLAWLAIHKQVNGRGIEIDPEQVRRALARGAAVVQGDVNTELVDFAANAFDVAVLSQSLQMLANPKAALAELMRIAPTAIVSVPNFGHYKNRLYLAMRGKMPVTKTLSYQWYDTPNIHFCTIADFVELCSELGITIEKRLMVSHEGRPRRFRGRGLWANLFGQQGVFVLRR